MRTKLPIFIALMLGTTFTVPNAPADQEGATVYQKMLHSSAWVWSKRGPGQLATGSGSLIDAKARLILTNFHVVGEVEQANIFFPSYDGERLYAEKTYYTSRVDRLARRGKVVARDRMGDLALIQLQDDLPRNVKALPLAAKSVQPGQNVHSIGNPGSSGALWVYTPGRVRQVYYKKWKAEVDGRTMQFESEVVETDSPTNPGDSGGPLVNERSELVGVTQGGALNANALSTFIDLSEVRKFLQCADAKKAGFQFNHRTKPLVSTDGARFFSPDKLKAANEAAKNVFEKKGRDIFIETYANIPDGKTAEVKAMKTEEQAKFVHDWTEARVKAEGVNGIMLLVCRDPSRYHVWAPKDPAIGLKQEDYQKLTSIIREKFKEKKFDEGLEEFVKLASEMLMK